MIKDLCSECSERIHPVDHFSIYCVKCGSKEKYDFYTFGVKIYFCKKCCIDPIVLQSNLEKIHELSHHSSVDIS